MVVLGESYASPFYVVLSLFNYADHHIPTHHQTADVSAGRPVCARDDNFGICGK